ncbi:hypothetical protein HB860_15550 [Aeromonas sp. 3925]|jgi:hypothetical protein|uniref:hypothetical protein n=1 Tax=Aeromonas genomosp. paramedia TaxID=3086176 RepID=UPI001FFC5CCB|nr:hypothetical protein [Aeromonas genomosp. paramedia]MCK2085342.1 hypothetical protein [Aeromonas genomosp. paramedia]
MRNTVSHLLARLLNSGAAFEAPLARRGAAQDPGAHQEAQGIRRSPPGDSAFAEGSGKHDGDKIGR